MKKEIIDYIRITKLENIFFEKYDSNEGMLFYRSKLGKSLFLVNTNTKKAYELVDCRNILQISNEDIDIVSLSERIKEEKVSAYIDVNSKNVKYGFEFLSKFTNGYCLLHWVYYPHMVNFEDYDGYGRRENNTINLYAIITDFAKIVVPFQPISSTKENIFDFLLSKIV